MPPSFVERLYCGPDWTPIHSRRAEFKADTWSKMAVGNARVAQAFGTSTIPEMRPSQGAQESNK